MCHLDAFKLLAFVLMVICCVHCESSSSCSIGTRDYEILSKRKESSTIRFPWSVDIYQFHYFRAHGVIISNKHILAPATHILPYKGIEVDTLDNGDGLPKFFWVEHTEVYITAKSRRKIDHAYIHPSYNPITYDHNIAVLEVDSSIPLDDDWIRAVFLPKTPLIASNGKVNIAFPVDTTLKPYMATVLSDDDCAQINGNTDVSTNILMCFDGLCSDHECDRYGGFSQPIFNIIADGSIEIIGLPLWSKKQVKNDNGNRTVSVYNRIADSLPWIEDILSKRCEHEPPIPNVCEQKLFFSKSCEKLIVVGSGSGGGLLNNLGQLFFG